MLDLLPSAARIEDVRTGTILDRNTLAAACAERAVALHEAGLRKGDRLGLCHRNSPALLIDLFAAWQLGATVIPLSASLTEQERRRAVSRYVLSLWISDQPLDGVSHLTPASVPSAPAEAAPIPRAQAEFDAPTLVLSTSGTTAEPKGVVLTRRAVLARCALNIEHIGRETLSRSLVTLPLHFGHGLIGNALTPLLAGATLVLWTEPALDGLAGLGPLLDEHGITFMSSVPSMWRVALRLSPKPVKGTLQRIHIGSEQLPPDLWRSIAAWSGGKPVFNMYGISETANWIGGADGETCGFVPGSVGQPWGGAIRIIDETGALTDHGRGEIAVATPGLMTGYWNDTAGTAAALNQGWFHTGDIGELDGQGLRIVGRLKHQINRGGIKISAEEIDALLRGHDDVEDACAFALPDAMAGEVVAAVVVAKPAAPLDVDALRQWCSGKVRAEAVPHRIMLAETLPRSERGKVKRDAVRDLFMSQQGERHA